MCPYTYLIGYKKPVQTHDNKGKTLIGQKFVLSVGSSFLYTGVTFVFSKVIGNFPLIKV